MPAAKRTPTEPATLQGTAPPQKVMPTSEGRARVRNGTVTPQKGMRPMSERTAPVRNGVTPPRKRTTPMPEVTAPVRDGVTPPRKRTTPMPERTARVRNGQPRGGVTPTVKRMASTVEGVTTARTGLGPERVIEIQRARILAAMVEVSAERGAANVTVAHVVERAGVSRRTFYELYSDREACFLAAFDELIARASRYVLEDYDPRAGWVERIRTALVALLSFLDLERDAGRLLIVGSLGAGAGALERRRHVLAQMIALVEEGRTQGKTGAGLPPLTAEGIVGGVLSVLHARLLDAPPPSAARGPHVASSERDSLLELSGPLMGMIVLPYLGSAAARRELERPAPVAPAQLEPAPADPLRDVQMRLTYRTVRVLMSVAARPGSSNREIGLAADIQDQGQISKLLTRLAKLGLIENSGAGLAQGAPNAWLLTSKGTEIEQAIRGGVAE
jgi:AcrR family transcriptional regulator